jgi:hypothetical protein
VKYQGTSKQQRKNGDIYYKSSITFRNKHISLGSYNLPEHAQDCYFLAKDILVNGKFSLLDFKPDLNISFEKWVILINFRDHNYYFKTPIYMHQYYFSYFISELEELYFDIEDLFYYATHKIHKRQGYYFVNDYGMQLNLLSRYGIKNHGVIYRDYDFIDHDSQNFRYENISVINPYYGVTRLKNRFPTVYKATINILGTYVIGTYSSVIEAAIAYNKAVDYVSASTAISKTYPKNYITELDKHAYQKAYEKIRISKKILAQS